jgi:uncharacterized membrane protein YfcA
MKMKDGLMLLIAGVLCAGGAALFFKFFGSEAFGVIVLVTLVSVLIDNARLRRRLREMGAKPEGKRTWL